MKAINHKSILAAVAATILCLVPMSMKAQEYERLVQSNHSISMQVFGLEYSYEQALGGTWSIIGRVGFTPTELDYHTDFNSASVAFLISPALVVEPRLYTSLGRRYDMGKDIYNNAADFVSLKTQVYIDDDDFALGITPMYGIRRTGGEHWAHEFTFGTKLTITTENLGLAPHLQYRLIFTF
ncbi:MAG: hypothetical protein MJZ16_13130 [Bacteroidales bacterium]|nr:hypothetical protein [Bacteroidales bacterium]